MSREQQPLHRERSPVTLGKAAWALMFVVVYVAVVVGGLVALGMSGLLELSLESILPIFLVGVTAAAMLALYVHLFRRNRFTAADLGFRRLTPRLFHLLWQIPASIIVCASLQSIFLLGLTSAGVDTESAATTNDPLADIAGLPVPLVVVCLSVIAVLTPIWEEILFRGAFLDGLSGRFRPGPAIVLSAVLFAAVHLVWVTFVYLFTLGIALALIRRFHQNLWAPIILHAVNNGLVALAILAVV